MKLLAAFYFTALSLFAQTNNLATTNALVVPAETNQTPAVIQRAEQIRDECLANRRLICGKIIKVLPGGIVLDSGYTDLLRPALSTTWLIPGTATASRPANAVEQHEPGAVAVGQVFLTDYPKSRGAAAKPKLYDYVVLLGYPAGQYTYTSVGTVQRTVRHFSASLLSAVKINFETAESAPPPPVK